MFRLRSLGLGHLADGRARVIEVGRGPIGLAGFLPAIEHLTIDPLEEALPCGTGRYDLAIVQHCLDDVRDIAAAMRELRRVLHATGTLYLTVNCRTSWGFLMHCAMSRMSVDPGPPHTFTPQRAERLLRTHGFQILHAEGESPVAARRADLAGRDPRTRLKGLLGVSEFEISVVAQPAERGYTQ